ncbi:hypothetical protein B0H13DRAFT_1923628 [Mycena leptocephala]|nr:hypothetical protein B0H13DRAFT_1923628 [Mycena leptocephala]
MTAAIFRINEAEARRAWCEQHILQEASRLFRIGPVTRLVLRRTTSTLLALARLKIESTPSLSWYGWGWRNGEIRVRDQGKACYWATLNEHFVLKISSHDSAKGGPLKTIWEGDNPQGIFRDRNGHPF